MPWYDNCNHLLTQCIAMGISSVGGHKKSFKHTAHTIYDNGLLCIWVNHLQHLSLFFKHLYHTRHLKGTLLNTQHTHAIPYLSPGIKSFEPYLSDVTPMEDIPDGKNIKSTLIRHRSNNFALNQCPINTDSRFFVIWDIGPGQCWVNSPW